MSDIDWRKKYEDATMALAHLKHMTKTQLSAMYWTPEYRELAEAIDNAYHKHSIPLISIRD